MQLTGMSLSQGLTGQRFTSQQRAVAPQITFSRAQCSASSHTPQPTKCSQRNRFACNALGDVPLFSSSGLSGPAASEEKVVMPSLDEIPLESEVRLISPVSFVALCSTLCTSRSLYQCTCGDAVTLIYTHTCRIYLPISYLTSR